MVEKQDGEIEKQSKIIAVIGPTASGKTRRAVSISKNFDGEIISADSRQVYRDMDLGTGKDIEEYDSIPYHLIDICEAGDKYNLHKYITDYRRTLQEIRKRGKLPVVCGGSGMYIENALSGIELPEVPANPQLREELEKYNIEELTEILKQYKNLHNTTDIDTKKRAIRAIEIELFYKEHPESALLADRRQVARPENILIGIDIPREKRRERISQRLKQRLDSGMVDEVERLLKRGIKPEDLIYYGLEYKFLTLYLIGRLSYKEMTEQLETAIQQFAKRQMTWFRGMEKRGFKINWLSYDMPDNDFLTEVNDLLKGEN